MSLEFIDYWNYSKLYFILIFASKGKKKGFFFLVKIQRKRIFMNIFFATIDSFLFLLVFLKQWSDNLNLKY